MSRRKPDSELRPLIVRAVRAGFDELASGPEAGEPQEPAAPPDRLGRYDILEEIGRGGVGTVYRASDPELDRCVALKVLHDHLSLRREAVERFRGEARLCSSLEHPGIVPVHEIGTLDDGRPYFTMRLVSGRTLAEALWKVPRHQALVWIVEICQVVAFAHDRGLAHGDLKPANILIGLGGSVHVVDWGFTRSLVGPSNGRSTEIAGTPDYMAPEQLREGLPASAATDAYGLGAILFETLAEEALADGIADSARAVRARLRKRAIDGPLADLVSTCLDPDPERRPSAADVATRMRDYLDGVERRTRELELSAALAIDRARTATRTRTLTIGLAVCAVTLIAWMSWSELQRRARIDAAQAGFRRSMAHAHELLGAARQDPSMMSTWDEALQVIHTALDLARHAEVTPDLHRRLAELEDTTLRERERAARDLRTLAALDDLRDHCAGDVRDTRLPSHYRRAFEEFGLSLTPANMAGDVEAIRDSAITERLTTALDDWALLTSSEKGAEATQLFRLSQAADDNPLRRALREAFRSNRDDALLTLVASPDFDAAPPPTISLANRQLALRGHIEAAIELCRRARLRYPDDFALTHDLATLLLRRSDIDWQRVMVLMASTIAMLPDNPHTWTDYAHAAIRAGRGDLGDEALDRALQLDPDYPRALIWKGRRTISAGRRGDGARLLVRGLEHLPNHVGGWNALGATLGWEGFSEEAHHCFEKALSLSPDNPVIWSNLGLGHLKLRDGHAAMAAFEHAAACGAGGATQACSAGFAMLLSGDFEAAAESIARGHALGAEDPDWNYPSDAWAARAERARELATLPARVAALNGNRSPGGPELLADRAWVAALADDAKAAVELYRAAFTAAPSLRFADAWIDHEHTWRDPHIASASRAALHAARAATNPATRASRESLAADWTLRRLEEIERRSETEHSQPRARESIRRVRADLRAHDLDRPLWKSVRRRLAILEAGLLSELPATPPIR